MRLMNAQLPMFSREERLFRLFNRRTGEPFVGLPPDELLAVTPNIQPNTLRRVAQNRVLSQMNLDGALSECSTELVDRRGIGSIFVAVPKFLFGHLAFDLGLIRYRIAPAATLA